jgi:hypothetical protein
MAPGRTARGGPGLAFGLAAHRRAGAGPRAGAELRRQLPQRCGAGAADSWPAPVPRLRPGDGRASRGGGHHPGRGDRAGSAARLAAARPARHPVRHPRRGGGQRHPRQEPPPGRDVRAARPRLPPSPDGWNGANPHSRGSALRCDRGWAGAHRAHHLGGAAAGARAERVDRRAGAALPGPGGVRGAERRGRVLVQLLRGVDRLAGPRRAARAGGALRRKLRRGTPSRPAQADAVRGADGGAQSAALPSTAPALQRRLWSAPPRALASPPGVLPSADWLGHWNRSTGSAASSSTSQWCPSARRCGRCWPSPPPASRGRFSRC